MATRVTRFGPAIRDSRSTSGIAFAGAARFRRSTSFSRTCPRSRGRAESAGSAARQHELALHLPRRHQLQRVRGLVQGKGLRHVGTKLALTEPAPELAHAVGELARLPATAMAPRYSHG